MFRISEKSLNHVTDETYRIAGDLSSLSKIEPVDGKALTVLGTLGRGNFGVITEVRKPGQDNQNKTFVKKTLSNDIPFNKKKWALKDLVAEAILLSKLDHKNIIGIVGVSTHNLKQLTSYRSFFIVLDKLYDTLSKQIERWQNEPPTTQNHLEREQKQWRILKELSAAIAHMHDLNMIHRDLKPDNIGFDENGVLKLFDLGLSRMLPKEDNKKNYHMSYAGSPRYMAPEIILDEDYGTSADVHSFAIVGYETMTLLTPYDGYDKKRYFEESVLQGQRPPSDLLPYDLQPIVRQSWHPDKAYRPTMKSVNSQLEQLQQAQDEDLDDLFDSALSF